MGLSSNILWHQTKKECLEKILESKRFLCAYSVEDVADMAGQNLAFPMVSMCDLPLSELTEFLGKYDHYTIGMSRDWGINNRFTPIWYYETRSRVPKFLKGIIEKAMNKGDESIVSLMAILSYMKKVEGPLPKRNYEIYRFYDEREVRHVPSFEHLVRGGNTPIFTEDEYENYKATMGSPVISAHVRFDWSDIRYVIVQEKSEVDEMKDIFDKLGCNNRHIGVFCEDDIIHDVIGYHHNVNSTSSSTTPATCNSDKRLVQLFMHKLNELM